MAEVSWLGGLDSMWLSSPELMCARAGYFFRAKMNKARTVAGSYASAGAAQTQLANARQQHTRTST
ncbi:hypothetical protein IPC1027_21185 [Pseudomonas aeruginosa]|nr:hypothetical protein IPC1027_21185 [Pseudomonas aeruginosa]